MATAQTNTNTNDQNQQQQQQGNGAQRVTGSPITNEAYNVVTALQAKLEGLEAYGKYAKDGNGQLWQQLTQSEMQAVGTLVDQLEQMVRDGKFRMQSGSGKGGGNG